MIETILLGRERKTGKRVELSKPGAEFSAQKAQLQEYHHEQNEEYDQIGLYQLVPLKKVLKLVTKNELKRQADLHQEQLQAGEQREKSSQDLSAATARLEAARGAFQNATNEKEAAEKELTGAKTAFSAADDAGKPAAKAAIKTAKTAAREAITTWQTAQEGLTAAQADFDSLQNQ